MNRKVKRAAPCAAVVFAAFASALQAADAPKGTPLSELPAAIKQAAKREFDAGRKCYIWKGNEINARLMRFADWSDDGIVVLGPFSVLAKPEDENIGFISRFRFLAVNKEKGSGDVVDAALVNESEVERASGKESRAFMVLIPKIIKEKKYSGKGTIEIYLAARDEPKGLVSNTIQLKVDFDSAQILGTSTQ